eukprot:scaffold256434_cov19-Tisochrysis_lutea.AAC.5
MLGFADLEAGAAVSGTRGYFLLHEGVLLNQCTQLIPMHAALADVHLLTTAGQGYHQDHECA